MIDARRLERRILFVSGAFVLSLFALVLLANATLSMGLPTCVTDIKPFDKGELMGGASNHYELRYVARMWRFEPADVQIPVGATVDIYLSTADVTHGFEVPGTNINLMAVPGTVNYARVKFDTPGDYEILCHEYCGAGHQNMESVIHVYDPIVAHSQMAVQPVEVVSNHPGYHLLEIKACLACHSVDGKPGTGPSFKKLYGRKETMQDGLVITVDAAYIRESIKQPMAEVVKSFSPVMPTLSVSDAEIDQIIAYMKTIGTNK